MKNNKHSTSPATLNPQADFAQISALITAARQRAVQAWWPMRWRLTLVASASCVASAVGLLR